MANDLEYEGTYIPDKAYDLGYDGGNSNKSNSTLTKEKEAIAEQLGYEASIAAKEEETGKFEADEVGVSDGIFGHSDLKEDKEANTSYILEHLISYGVESSISDYIESLISNSDEIVDNIIQKIMVSLGISYPTLSGAMVIYPFSNTLSGISKVAENITKLLGTNGSLLAKAGTSALVGTIVSSAIGIINGEDWTEVIPESIVKSVPVALLMTGISLSGAPALAVFISGLLISIGMDSIYNSNALGIKDFAELMTEGLEAIEDAFTSKEVLLE